MKILQVFDFFSLPHGGGTVDVISKLSKALADRGHEVTLWTGDYNVDKQLIRSLKLIEFHTYRSYINKFGIYYMPDLEGEELNDTWFNDFDVIHFHCYRSYQNAVLYKKAIKAGVPYVIDAHGSTVDRGPKNVIRKLYDYAYGYDCLKYASRVIAETDIGVAEWKKLGVPESKITLLHPFIDVHEFENLPDVPEVVKRSLKMVLFLGRINKDKGLKFLADAFAALCKSRNDVCLVIAGQDDGYGSEIRSILAGKGIRGNVVFTGFLTGKEKIRMLTTASMLIQPSKNEAGARPSLEALMCGTPVIVTDNTGAGLEIGKMGVGFTVRYGDVQDMADAMEATFNSPPHNLVIKGQKYIRENLSLESQIPKYEQLYKEVIG